MLWATPTNGKGCTSVAALVSVSSVLPNAPASVKLTVSSVRHRITHRPPRVRRQQGVVSHCPPHRRRTSRPGRRIGKTHLRVPHVRRAALPCIGVHKPARWRPIHILNPGRDRRQGRATSCPHAASPVSVTGPVAASFTFATAAVARERLSVMAVTVPAVAVLVPDTFTRTRCRHVNACTSV